MKRILIILVLLTLLVIMFRGSIYRATAVYEFTGTRRDFSVKDKAWIAAIEAEVDPTKDYTIEDIIQLSLDITAKHLAFKASAAEKNPNKVMAIGEAHCVGYAAFYAATCNHLLKKFRLHRLWQAKHHKARIYLFGNHVNKIVKRDFLKDHNFVAISNKETEERFHVDPCMYDRFNIAYVTVRSK